MITVNFWPLRMLILTVIQIMPSVIQIYRISYTPKNSKNLMTTWSVNWISKKTVSTVKAQLPNFHRDHKLYRKHWINLLIHLTKSLILSLIEATSNHCMLIIFLIQQSWVLSVDHRRQGTIRHLSMWFRLLIASLPSQDSRHRASRWSSRSIPRMESTQLPFTRRISPLQVAQQTKFWEETTTRWSRRRLTTQHWPRAVSTSL